MQKPFWQFSQCFIHIIFIDSCNFVHPHCCALIFCQYLLFYVLFFVTLSLHSIVLHSSAVWKSEISLCLNWTLRYEPKKGPHSHISSSDLQISLSFMYKVWFAFPFLSFLSKLVFNGWAANVISHQNAKWLQHKIWLFMQCLSEGRKTIQVWRIFVKFGSIFTGINHRMMV